jgi:hypothetical protein
MVEGEVLAASLTVPYASTVSSPVTAAYLHEEDVSSTVLSSGSDAASGNVITMETFTPSVDIRGPYVLTVTFTNGSQTEVKKVKVHVSLKEDDS